jgi:hypothetical protein
MLIPAIAAANLAIGFCTGGSVGMVDKMKKYFPSKKMKALR